MTKNTLEEMEDWHKEYKELIEATKHIKPIHKHVFAGLKNPIRIKRGVVRITE